MTDLLCTYPRCKCIVLTSTTEPNPVCPKGLPSINDLSPNELDLLRWLGEEDFSQYGECHGKSLNVLIGAGLAKLYAPGEHQSGFIAKDYGGNKGDMYRAVSLTDEGRAALILLKASEQIEGEKQ